MKYVIVPGLDGSDDRHWQSVWEAGRLPSPIRIEPSSWTAPDLDDWSKAIGTAVDRAGSEVIFLAHSLGCLAVAHWLTSTPSTTVRGAFLVAPPDQLAPTFPTALLPTFAPLAATRLDVAAVLVASDKDPYCTMDAASRLAAGWAVPLITAGPQGHINSDSGLGSWDLGQNLLTAFVAGLGLTVVPAMQ